MASNLIFYTARGDDGTTTRLGGRERLRKDSLLMEVVGTVDEASAAIGVARASLSEVKTQTVLREVQERLIRLMGHLSATPETREKYQGLTAEDRAWLEERIVELGEGLPPLREFVLPGRTPPEAACHLARTIVRRAERRLLTLMSEEPSIGAENLAFLNRLSSLLFVVALRERAQHIQ